MTNESSKSLTLILPNSSELRDRYEAIYLDNINRNDEVAESAFKEYQKYSELASKERFDSIMVQFDNILKKK
jgi:hypothetical protein